MYRICHKSCLLSSFYLFLKFLCLCLSTKMFNNCITISPPHLSSSHGLESVCALNAGCVKSARQQPPPLSFIILLSSSPGKENECTTWSQNHNSIIIDPQNMNVWKWPNCIAKTGKWTRLAAYLWQPMWNHHAKTLETWWRLQTDISSYIMPRLTTH